MKLEPLSISALAAMTKKGRRSVTKRLSDAQIAPAKTVVQSTRTIDYYWPHEALPVIYQVDTGDLDLTAERARLAKAQADKTEMENEHRSGELVELDEITRIVERGILACRTHLLALPTKLSPYLEGKTVSDIYSQLEDGLHEALTELSNIPFGDIVDEQTD